jgi:urease accessory protein
MIRRQANRGWALGGALAGMAPQAAEAHLATTRFGDFYGGALHVVTAPEHVLALLALGLVTGLQEPRDGRWMLAAAPAGLLAGSLAALVLPLTAPTAALGMAVLLGLGLLVALAWRVPAVLLSGLGLLVGLLHGYQNGLAIGSATVAYLFILGITASGLVAVALIAAAATRLHQRVAWGNVAIRAGGSWIAALGLMMLGFAFA